MATAPNPAMSPQGAAPQGAAPGASQPGAPATQPTGGMEPHRMLAALTRLAQILAQSVPALAPEMEQITTAASNGMRKIVAAQPQQGSAPAAPPY